MRFVSCFGKPSQHNNARKAQTKAQTCEHHLQPKLRKKHAKVVSKAATLAQKQTNSNSTLHSRNSSKSSQKSTTKRPKIDEKPSPNDQKIDQNSLLDSFGRQKPFRGRVGTRSGRARHAPVPAQERSWDAPGAPRAAGGRPRASPGRLPLIRLPQGPGFYTFEFPSFFPSLFSFFFSLPCFIAFLSHFPLFFFSFFSLFLSFFHIVFWF